MCQLWSYTWAVQPFLMDTWAAMAAGSASTMPQCPPPVCACWSATPPCTLCIALSSQPVHTGPAALPVATHWPRRTASAGDIVVYDQLLARLGRCVPGSPHRPISSLIEASPPLIT